MSTDRFSKITIRQPRPLKAKIARAAALRGMTVTSFINGTLEQAADKMLERARQRELTDRDSRALISLLSNPPTPAKSLRDAARRFARAGRD